MVKCLKRILTGTLAVGVAFMYPTTEALAQNITLDGTLGTPGTLTGPNYQIPQSVGEAVGDNLFHSFGKFNLNSNEAAIFQSAGNIRNILSRVTGGNPSSIDGLIRTLGNDVNFFLINPSGIVFGENARLDVNGSFVGSTANAIQFGEQGFFSATNPQTPSQLLTINPSALLFNQVQPGKIESKSNLQVPNNRSLLLVGGDINLDGGGLNALGGSLELAGLVGDGAVGLNVNGNNLSLNIPDDVERADVSLTNGVIIDVSAGGGGSITVNAKNLEVTQGSQILAGIRSGLGTPEAQAGDITINATSLVKFDGEDNDGNNSGAFSQVNSNAVGKAGGISITTGSLEVTNGAQVSASTDGVGDAGSVIINTTDFVKFDGETKDTSNSGAFSNVNSGAVGKAGGVSITTASLEVLNGAQLGASTFGGGDAGSVIINATDSVKFDGEGKDGFPSGVFSQVSSNAEAASKAGDLPIPIAVGKAGGISITTGSLEVTNGASLIASTFGEGDAGTVTINATSSVKFNGESKDGSFTSGAFSQVESGAVGNGGGVSITTGSLKVTNGAQVSASTNGKGDAGTVTINATDFIKFDRESKRGFDSGAFSNVNTGGVGKAGGVFITTGILEVTNGAKLRASTNGKGDAGAVTINATDFVKFGGEGGFSGAFSTVQRGAVGKAGGVSITTGILEVTNGAELSASTFGVGNAGTVTINTTDFVQFDGEDNRDGVGSGAFSVVNTGAVGKAGGVSITTGSLKVINGAQLGAGTFGEGDAGTVNINATDFVQFDGKTKNGFPTGVFSAVAPNAEGKAGGISITTDSLEVTNGARVSASTSSSGEAGDITLNVSENITLAGSATGIFASTSENSTGKGGSIIIDPKIMTIRDGARIAVNSQGEGIGGDIELAAGFLTLDNGTISAETRSNTGGNIDLNLQDVLLLRNGSQISTTAGFQEFGGDGGDISIDVPNGFIVALPNENSDITANAFSGNGGQITIDANNIFGIAPLTRDELIQQLGTDNPQELNPNNLPSSNITAISQQNPNLNGDFTITDPDIDPNRGLIELPENLVDASQQISQACTPRGRQNASTFISTGRGGLPSSPNEPLRKRAVITNWVDLPAETTERRINKLPTASVTKSTPKIIEAQKIVVDKNGDTFLVAESPQNHTPSTISCN